MRRQRLQRDREFAGLRIVAPAGSRDGFSSTIFSTKITSRTG